jgi:long-chain acyl-CoA synthetase
MGIDLYRLIEPAIQSYPERIALITPDGQPVSYGKLARTVQAFSAAALDASLRRGDRVTLEIDNYAVQVCLMLGLSRLGVVTIMGGSTDAVLAAGLHVDAAITLERIKKPEPRNILFSQAWFAPAGDRDLPLPGFADERETALVVASSGTTGQRKFMPLSIARVAGRLALFDPLYGTGFPNKMITIGPMTQYGFLLILRALQHGWMVMRPGDSPRKTLELMNAHAIDEICTIPNVVMDLVRAQETSPLALPSLKQIVIGGSAISREAMREAQARVCQSILTSYGATEVGPIAAASIDQLAGKPAGAVGYVRRGAEVRVVDDSGAELPGGTQGQLKIRVASDLQVEKYLNAGPAAETSLKDGWFYPGDTGYVMEDGMLVVTGRVSDVINVGGNKLAPGAIEAMLAAVAGVRQAAAVGVGNAAGFEDVCVAVVCEPMVTEDALRTALMKRLGRTTPLRVKILDSIPLNAGGKPDRSKLRGLFEPAGS